MDPIKNVPPQETKLHFLDYWRIIRIRKTVILAVFLLVVITATLVTYMYPESYASTARILVEKNQPDIPGIQSQQQLGYDIFFLQTEFQIIQSEIVLGRVVEALDLNNVWGKKFNTKLKTAECINIIKRNLDLEQVKNTSLIDIRYFSEKPEEAALIANKIAEVYKEYRQEEAESTSVGGVKSLEEQYSDLDTQVNQAREKVDKLREELQIPDQLVNGDAPAPLLSAEVLRQYMSKRTEAEADLKQKETLLASLEQMTPEERKNALPRAIQDNQLNELLSQLNLAEQKLIQLKQDYSSEHPVYKTQKEAVDYLTEQVAKNVQGALQGLKAQVEKSQAYLAAIDAAVDKAKQDDIAFAAKSSPYFAAKRELSGLQTQRDFLKTKIFTQDVEQKLPHTRVVRLINEARPDQHAVKPNKPLNIILGVVIGLVVGIGLAFFIEYLDTSVKTIDDVERTLQAPVLGVIPQNVGLILNEGSESPHAEAYRVLRTNLLFSRKDDRLNTVVVVSAGVGEGKSTTVFNLATIFAQNGSRVVVVDSDLRRPTLHKMIQVSNNLGLTNYLLKQNSLEEVIQTTGQPGLDLLASGKLPSSSIGILSSGQMKGLISELKQRYDYVFFDSPPIMDVSDASILASEVDMTIQVIQYRRYPQPMNIRAKQMIEKVGGNLIGIVLNNINMSQDESYYYYSGYYHDYYYSRNEDQAKDTAASGASAEKAKLDINQKF